MTIPSLFSISLINSFNLQFGSKFLPPTIWIHSPSLGPLKLKPLSLKAACQQRKSHVGVDTIDAHIAAQQRRGGGGQLEDTNLGDSKFYSIGGCENKRFVHFFSPILAESSHFDDVIFEMGSKNGWRHHLKYW